MALKDNAVVTAALGYVFVHDTVGTAAPTPTELDDLDPLLFGCQVLTLKLSSGTAASGTFTVTVGGSATTALPYNASATVVQTALEALATVGVGNVTVTGTSLVSPGFDITWVETLQGAAPTTTADGALLVGSTPVLGVTVKTAANGWKNIGHTSRDDMPEFGFDGGDTEVKGTWQRKRLREVASGDPVADSVTIKLEQWDTTTLELYFGEDSASTPGVFGVSGEFVPVEKAFLILIIDGTARIGFYAPKASIKRDDSIELPVDEFSSLPVKATFLNLGARRLYDWISQLFV